MGLTRLPHPTGGKGVAKGGGKQPSPFVFSQSTMIQILISFARWLKPLLDRSFSTLPVHSRTQSISGTAKGGERKPDRDRAPIPHPLLSSARGSCRQADKKQWKPSASPRFPKPATRRPPSACERAGLGDQTLPLHEVRLELPWPLTRLLPPSSTTYLTTHPTCRTMNEHSPASSSHFPLSRFSPFPLQQRTAARSP